MMISDFLTSNPNKINNQTRQHKQKIRIVQYISRSEKPRIVPEITKYMRISTPTTIKLVSELLEEGILIEEGKKETASGRKPILYTINRELFYAIGIDVQLKGLKLCLMRVDMEVVRVEEFSDFELTNNQTCLDQIESLIVKFIQLSNVSMASILGVGIGLTGRVNTHSGEAFSYFNFMDLPLAAYLSDRLNLSVFVDNDTRAQGLAEQVFGEAKGVANVMVVNLSRGLGLSIVANGKMVTGGMGFAGEFGHMQLGNKKRHCLCGKQNCLGTEVSGFALEEDFKEACSRGDSSLLQYKEGGPLNYKSIMKVAMKGDGLAIDLIHQQGEKLGMALGNLLNLLNPSLIIIGGGFSCLEQLILDPVKIGLMRTALVNPMKFCQLTCSQMDGDLVIAQGIAALVFKKFELI